MEPADDEMRQIDLVKIYSTKKCLVIDDFPEIRGSLMRTLRTFGVESVDTASDGDEAVKLCTQNSYNLVICDYNLGSGQDGQQVLEEVRYLRVLLMTSLFIMLTGESSREMVLGALECQPDDYITKPYTEGSLRARLNRAILRHEALMPIKQAISDGDYHAALDGCNDMIRARSRYAGDCIKMKGHLLCLLRQLKAAQKLYESVLDKKPLVWARLGLSKTLIGLGKLESAESILEEVIKEDSRYVEAHDLLADIYVARSDIQKAQESMERASQVSPKSVLRHRKLADLAELNGNHELAMNSHRRAIKWGANSCHESAQDYFNYVRKVSDVVRDSDNASEDKLMVKQAISYLDRARKRYLNSPEVAAQSHMIQAQLLHGQGEQAKALESVKNAKKLYSQLKDPSVDASLELVRTLHAMNEENEARKLLAALAAKHPDDRKLLRIIDGITGEPISENGKLIAAKLTKAGISYYEKRDFDAAIDIFNKAISAYPKHVGLNLNLIQAVLAATDLGGPCAKYEKMCQRSLRAVGRIPLDHKQHERYLFLQRQLAKHYPKVLSAA